MARSCKNERNKSSISLTVHEKRVVVSSGYVRFATAALNSVEVFDHVTNIWSSIQTW